MLYVTYRDKKSDSSEELIKRIIKEFNKRKIADMHTHSCNSHDSECEIEDMLRTQLEKGTGIFAVTDHFDTHRYAECDIFTPIEKSFQRVAELNLEYEGECLVLAGVEIGEGFWSFEAYNQIINLLPYDVVIGSVHVVRHEELSEPYSQIDFSRYGTDTIYEFLDKYFDDVLALLEKEEFDILAHLTCPVRYITGKYKIPVDMSVYEAKINKILEIIIERNIALEVNTSAYDLIGDFMPSSDILKKYYDMGGYLVTLGSDAHVSENASKDFDKAIDTLKEIGFSNIYYYIKRKAYKTEI